MFDEPFNDAPGRGTFGYRLFDSLLFLSMVLFWWLYFYAGMSLMMLGVGRAQIEAEGKL